MKTEESKSAIGLKLFILKQEKKDLSILVKHRITVSHQSYTAVEKVNVLLGYIRRGMSHRRDREILILLEEALV